MFERQNSHKAIWLLLLAMLFTQEHCTSTTKNADGTICTSNCAGNDPPGSLGAVILQIRSFEAAESSIKDILSIIIVTDRVEVVSVEKPGGAPHVIIAENQPRSIEILNNKITDTIVGQYQIPAGFITGFRIFPRSVTIRPKKGADIALAVPSANLPSWDQSGWKIEPTNGTPWPVIANEMNGVRAFFQFDDRVHFNKGNGYMIKPTVQAEPFMVNPPGDKPGVFYDALGLSLA